LNGLSIEVTDGPDGPMVRLAGELDQATAPRFRAVFPRIVGSHRVDLDVSGITFVDSSGLRAFVELDDLTEARGGSLRIKAPTDRLRRLLDVTALVDVLDVA
jgi:anti-sigma B factor antagonist